MGVMFARISEKLLISGRSSFPSERYFWFLEHFLRFAWHTEVVGSPAPLNREAPDIWRSQLKTIRKPPNPTARDPQMTLFSCRAVVYRGRCTQLGGARRVYRGVHGGVHHQDPAKEQISQKAEKRREKLRKSSPGKSFCLSSRNNVSARSARSAQSARSCRSGQLSQLGHVGQVSQVGQIGQARQGQSGQARSVRLGLI